MRRRGGEAGWVRGEICGRGIVTSQEESSGREWEVGKESGREGGALGAGRGKWAWIAWGKTVAQGIGDEDWAACQASRSGQTCCSTGWGRAARSTVLTQTAGAAAEGIASADNARAGNEAAPAGNAANAAAPAGNSQ